MGRNGQYTLGLLFYGGLNVQLIVAYTFLNPITQFPPV